MNQLTGLTAWPSNDNLNTPFLPTNLLVGLTATQAAEPASGDAGSPSLAIEEADDDLASGAAWAGVRGSRRRQLRDQQRRV